MTNKLKLIMIVILMMITLTSCKTLKRSVYYANHPDPIVQVQAINHLRKYPRNEVAKNVILKALEGKNYKVVIWAIRSAGKMRLADAKEQLTKLSMLEIEVWPYNIQGFLAHTFERNVKVSEEAKIALTKINKK